MRGKCGGVGLRRGSRLVDSGSLDVESKHRREGRLRKPEGEGESCVRGLAFPSRVPIQF